MTMTPREIQEKQFHDAFRGYSHEEVDLFIDQISDSYDQIFRDNQALRSRVEELEGQLRSGVPAQSQPRSEPAPPVRSESEDMLKRMLVTAQETADKAVQSARAKAQVMIEEAGAKVRRLQEQAEALSSSTLQDAQRRAREMLAAAAGEEKDLRDRIDGLRSLERDFRARLGAFIRSQLDLLEAKPPILDAPSVALGSSFFDRKMLSGGEKLSGLGPKATASSGFFETPSAPASPDAEIAIASEPTKVSTPDWLTAPAAPEPEPTKASTPDSLSAAEAAPAQPAPLVKDQEPPRWPQDPEAPLPESAEAGSPEGPQPPPDRAVSGSSGPQPESQPASRRSEPGAGDPRRSADREETRSIRELFWGED